MLDMLRFYVRIHSLCSSLTRFCILDAPLPTIYGIVTGGARRPRPGSWRNTVVLKATDCVGRLEH